MKNKTEIHPVNSHVGQRLRTARKAVSLSQAELGKRLKQPITFQQVQKYERGTNRIAVAKLWEFAEVLHLPVEYFLPSEKAEAGYCFTLEELELLNRFRDLPKDAQVALLSLLKIMR